MWVKRKPHLLEWVEPGKPYIHQCVGEKPIPAYPVLGSACPPTLVHWSGDPHLVVQRDRIFVWFHPRTAVTSSHDYYHGRGVRGMMWTSPVEQLHKGQPTLSCENECASTCMCMCAYMCVPLWTRIMLCTYCNTVQDQVSQKLRYSTGALIECYTYHIKGGTTIHNSSYENTNRPQTAYKW